MTVAHKTDDLKRWPAILHPDAAERCYYPQRRASLAWVDGLETRGGNLRSARICACGDPVAAWRVDGAVSWQHKWCRDRACYACARSRSRELSRGLNVTAGRALDDGSPVSFTTVTQPKVKGERADVAWGRFQRSWERLRHTQEWREHVLGGVLTRECTWSEGHECASQRIPGWHMHGHAIIEWRDDRRVACPTCEGTQRVRGKHCRSCSSAKIKGDGTMHVGAAAVLRAWRTIVGGSLRAQCSVDLHRESVGQLAKYVTKLWDLPVHRARQLFDALSGKRLINGFGSWRSWQRDADLEATPSGWYSSGVTLRDIEARPDAAVSFCCSLPGGLQCPAQGRGDWRPSVAVATMSGREVLAALARDPRPVWERCAETHPQHADLCAAMAAELRARSRLEYKGLSLGRGPPPAALWVPAPAS